MTTVLDFHPLTFADEPDGVTVGRPDTGDYVLLPTDGAALLRKLSGGMPVTEAEDWYRTEFGERVDMADFVDSLRELGFVRAGDEELLRVGAPRWQRLGRAAFSPLAWLCYAVIVGASVVAMVAEPALRPRVANVFFSPSLVVVQLALVFVQMPAVLWHECYHMLAGRRLGLHSRLGVGRRWYYFVFETELNGLHGVPRAKRYLPMLAGMVGDLVLYGCLVLVAAADLSGGLSPVGRFALAVAYVMLLRLVWQCYLNLRTDLYFVLTTALGCTDPHAATMAYLREKFRAVPGVRPSTVDLAEFSPRDRRVAPAFAVVTAAGFALLVLTAVLTVLPVAVEFVRQSGAALSAGATEPRFWDSVVSLVLLVAQFVVLPSLAGKSTTRKEAP
ncbi:hypothetical protein [Actinophytocola oryzae]|uniref:Peptide zinc metalloprotease protein n=1 Tax=Actinophytocola oryzae TaxID=502181 RepID=A0A4R7W316_9PSEU|nr:hypothetical protein [Actinophytocola oryzae]TDV56279.1 hypothetical protein CLV71_102345 [Actinophytocola oryzae]